MDGDSYIERYFFSETFGSIKNEYLKCVRLVKIFFFGKYKHKHVVETKGVKQ